MPLPPTPRAPRAAPSAQKNRPSPPSSVTVPATNSPPPLGPKPAATRSTLWPHRPRRRPVDRRHLRDRPRRRRAPDDHHHCHRRHLHPFLRGQTTEPLPYDLPATREKTNARYAPSRAPSNPSRRSPTASRLGAPSLSLEIPPAFLKSVHWHPRQHQRRTAHRRHLRSHRRHRDGRHGSQRCQRRRRREVQLQRQIPPHLRRDVNKQPAAMSAPNTPATNVSPAPPAPKVPKTSPGQFRDPNSLAVDESPGGEGDIYVGDPDTGLVQKFTPLAQIVAGWGVKGQKDGTDLPGNQAHIFGPIINLYVDPVTGYLYVDDLGNTFPIVNTYTRSGTHIELNGNEYFCGCGAGPGFQLNPAGGFDESGVYTGFGRTPLGPVSLSYAHGVSGNPGTKPVTLPEILTTGFAIDPAPGELPFEGELYQDSGSLDLPLQLDCNPEFAPCVPFDSFGTGQLSAAEASRSIAPTHIVYAANSSDDDVAVFSDIRPEPTTEAALEIGETTLTFTGKVNPEARRDGPIAECLFEWGFTRSYGNIAPCEQATPYPGTEAVTAKLEGLTPIAELPIGTEYHYRLVASNEKGATEFGADHTAITTAPPQIEGVSSSHLTADLRRARRRGHPQRPPHHLPLRIRHHHRLRPDHPRSRNHRKPRRTLRTHKVKIPIEGLQRGATYHFRLLAENELGRHRHLRRPELRILPPACPNSAVRQQTGSAYLPDCRAYELVSPANAEAPSSTPAAPTPARPPAPPASPSPATSAPSPAPTPSTLAATSTSPPAPTPAGSPSYIGLPGNEAGCMGGPPNDPTHTSTIDNPTDSATPCSPTPHEPLPRLERRRSRSTASSATTAPPALTTGSRPPLQRPLSLERRRHPRPAPPHRPRRAPRRPRSSRLPVSEGTLEPGLHRRSHRLRRPQPPRLLLQPALLRRAANRPHQAPGSAYDDDLATGTVKLISALEGTANRSPRTPPSPPARNAIAKDRPRRQEEFLRFPAVSADGSHVLMSTATAADGSVNVPRATATPPDARASPIPPSTSTCASTTPAPTKSPKTSHRRNAAVNYVGMTPDGSKVFFTSEEHLTAEDPNTAAPASTCGPKRAKKKATRSP